MTVTQLSERFPVPFDTDQRRVQWTHGTPDAKPAHAARSRLSTHGPARISLKKQAVAVLVYPTPIATTAHANYARAPL
jgi:hypothetical protein